jgi:hypothetical protein
MTVAVFHFLCWGIVRERDGQKLAQTRILSGISHPRFTRSVIEVALSEGDNSAR